MNQTHWLPGIVALVVSAVAAAIALTLFKRRQLVQTADDGVADLDRRVQLLLDELNELSADRHQLAPEEFTQRHHQIEEQAASALRARDQARQARAAPRPPDSLPIPASGFWARNPQVKGGLWGAGIVIFFVVLGVFLTQDQKPRGQGEATGRAPGTDRPPPTDDAAFQAALERIKTNPQDLATAALVGHELIRRQQWEQAEKVTERALGVDPFFVENRIHRAVLMVPRGQTEEAIHQLEHLGNSYPDAAEAFLFLGGLMMESGDKRKALDSFERYAAEAPPNDQPPPLARVIQTLRRELNEK